eukprot:CAMPEP_0174250348 /NCGR_PEP_ID=MMETSP0439-20130205/546_1 /TAXON_ID=0 /ORGANISM="Stereomyxa ramosa, Strain Chinc5" /LENGTH=343 /DNA_ID=CAMNT_0015330385 /DNA_START=23 /DNA_END=1054 /DNA_ORIENTATION=+
MSKRDYYEVLGIGKNASDADIKKAYKKGALRYHPDRNPDNQEEATEKFKEISEAYEVLSDPEKKKTYDRFGHAGLEGGMPGGGGGGPGGATYTFHATDPEEIFKQFFGGSFRGGGGSSFFSMFDDEDNMGGSGFQFQSGGMPGGAFHFGGGGGGGGRRRRARSRKAPSIQVHFSVSLEDLAKGVTKKMKVTRKEVVNGQLVPKEKVLEINVKPGWKAGTKITFEREGDQSLDGTEAADIIFVLDEKPHPTFTREGVNLIYNHNITLTQALCGTNFSIKGLDDRVIPVQVDEVISPGYKKYIRGQGMPDQKNPNRRGDIIVNFNIVFPQRLSESQKRLIKQANM